MIWQIFGMPIAHIDHADFLPNLKNCRLMDMVLWKPPPHDIVGRGTCFGGLGLLNVYACRIPVSSYKHKTFQSGCKIQVQKSKAISIPVGFYVK